MVEKPLLPKIT